MQAFKVSCNDEMRLVPLKKDSSFCLALLVHNVALKFQRHPATFRLASPDLAYEPVPLEAEPAFEALMASLGSSGKPIRLTMILLPPPAPPPHYPYHPQHHPPPDSHPSGGQHPGHHPPSSPQNGPPSLGSSAPAPMMPPQLPTSTPPMPMAPQPPLRPQVQSHQQPSGDVPHHHKVPISAPGNPLPLPATSPVAPPHAAPLPRGNTEQQQQQQHRQQQQQQQQLGSSLPQHQHYDDSSSSSSAGSEEEGEESQAPHSITLNASLELVHPSAGESWTLIQEPVQEEDDDDDDDDTSSSDDDHRPIGTSSIITPTPSSMASAPSLPAPMPTARVAAETAAAVDVASAVAAARAEAYQVALLETEAKLRREMAAAETAAAQGATHAREKNNTEESEKEKKQDSTATTTASTAEAASQDGANEGSANENEEVAEREALKKAIARAREERQQREAIERQELAARQAQEEALAAQQAQARAADASAARAKKEAEERNAAVQRSRADAQAAVGRWVRRLSAPGLAVALVGCVPEAFNLAYDDAAAAAANDAGALAASDGAVSTATSGGSSTSSNSSSSASSRNTGDISGYPPAPVGSFDSCPVDFRVDRPLVEALKGLFGALTPHQIFELQQMLQQQQQQQQQQDQQLHQPLLQLHQQQQEGGQTATSAHLPQQQQARSSADLLALCRRGILPQLGAGGLSVDAIATFFANLACAQTPSPYPLVLGSDSDTGIDSSNSASSNTRGVASAAAVMPPHLKPLLDALSSKMVRFRCVAVAAELFARVLVAALWEEVALDATLLDWDANNLDDPSVAGIGSDDDDSGDDGGGQAASSSSSSQKSFLLSGVGAGASFVGLSSAGRSRLLTAMSLQSMSLEEVVSAVENLAATEKEDQENAAQALHDEKAAAWARSSAGKGGDGNELEDDVDQDHDELALAHRHQEDPAAPSLFCSGSEAMEVLKLLGSCKRDAYCASQSLPLLWGGNSTMSSSSSSHRGASVSTGAGNERVKLKPFLEYAGLAHLERALVRACGGAAGALSGHHTAFGSSSSGDAQQQQQLTVGALRFLLPSEDLSGRGGLAPADVSVLFRSLAVASGWGWRLAQHRATAQLDRSRRKAARAARRAAGSGVNLATPDAYPPPQPHLLINGAVHPAWAETVVRSPRFAERCVRLLLGAAGAAATQRERYDQSATSNGSAPGPMDLPVTFGLPWAGGGALRSDA